MIRNLPAATGRGAVARAAGPLWLCIRHQQQHTCFISPRKRMGNGKMLASHLHGRARAHFFLSRLSAQPLFRSLVFLAARACSYETRCERERESTKYEMQRDTLEPVLKVVGLPAARRPWSQVCLKACLYGDGGREGGHSNTHAK